MIQSPFHATYAAELRAQLKSLRRSIDRRNPVEREAERVLSALVKLMTEAAGIAAQQARLLHRGEEIEAEMNRHAERLQRLGAGKTAAPATTQ